MDRTTAEIVTYYAERYDEASRLGRRPQSRLERIRTLELLRELLPPAPATILDVGGGPGAYARPLEPWSFTTYWIVVAAVAIAVGCAEIAWHYVRYATATDRRRSRARRRPEALKITVIETRMTSTHQSFAHLADDDLLATVKRLATTERRATAALVRSLMELDARRLYLGEGYSSLFTYCTQALHLAEGAAYNRIEAARAARRFPAILTALEEGAVTLTTVRLVAPHLTPANHQDVLARAQHKGKREIEELVASLRPLPPVLSTIRKVPESRQVLLDMNPVVPTPVSSRSRATRMRSFAACRRSADISFRQAIRRRSSIARSPCSSTIWSVVDVHRCGHPARCARRSAAPGTFPRR